MKYSMAILAVKDHFYELEAFYLLHWYNCPLYLFLCPLVYNEVWTHVEVPGAGPDWQWEPSERVPLLTARPSITRLYADIRLVFRLFSFLLMNMKREKRGQLIDLFFQF